MDKMTFKDFTWPENPQIYREESRRDPQYETNDLGQTSFLGLGGLRKSITGSGVFSGAGAYTSYKALAALMNETTAGTLTHPVWDDCQAFLVKLELQQEPRIDYVAYSFEFLAADSSGAIPK